ncbi:helix-turn-helix domain-containing protein [Candidatus Symbiothrix dinenymphae]|uniref:helix-turn-helix domain-containing protein n=1 Tax=Candidatus Symbiothrix dinenymphae TaxID=467085 RepID=UPI0006C19FFD|nr:helix-turn-helix transcriptional regulator [Candidatus Symbiothrix dinenymphae]GAP72654.1 hypothetical protein SAMD00024442_39_6 [Candidatus Symbiothrix dinenymphae]
MKEVIKKLEQHASLTPSGWREVAEHRQTNKTWMRYSQYIAMLMMDKMEDLGLTQTALAAQMNVSQQYISKVLKGRENLSIETLAKIEDILHIGVLEFA